jgi:methionine sulfoxide reductase heme-binding subunit
LTAKAAVFVACLLPFAYLVWRAVAGDLGANPIEAVTLSTGRWALRLLLVTLAVTPLRRVTGWNRLISYRRMLGLFGFFYASLHFAIYIVIDQFFDWETIVEDIAKRPFITVGFAAFVLLVPLAVTSTKGWIRRLGRRWQRLHRLIYVAASLAVVHFIWKVKSDLRDPLFYASILGLLLGFRAVWWLAKRTRAPASLRGPADQYGESGRRTNG